MNTVHKSATFNEFANWYVSQNDDHDRDDLGVLAWNVLIFWLQAFSVETGRVLSFDARAALLAEQGEQGK